MLSVGCMFVPTYCTYLPTCLPACLPACLPTYLPTYLYIYIYMCVWVFWNESCMRIQFCSLCKVLFLSLAARGSAPENIT